MSLGATNLAQVPSPDSPTLAGSTSMSSSPLTVIPGSLLIVPAIGYAYGDAGTPTLAISATGGGWSWSPISPVSFNGAYFLAVQWFAATVPAGVTSTTITCTFSTPTATETITGFAVDQITGQGTLGSNAVLAWDPYTTTPGANLPSPPAATSMVYSLGVFDPITTTVTNPSGFTGLCPSFDVPGTGGSAYSLLQTAYVIGSASQGPNDWGSSAAQGNTIGYLEIPLAPPPVQPVISILVDHP